MLSVFVCVCLSVCTYGFGVNSFGGGHVLAMSVEPHF